jgi:hypothetical protein
MAEFFSPWMGFASPEHRNLVDFAGEERNRDAWRFPVLVVSACESLCASSHRTNSGCAARRLISATPPTEPHRQR